MLKATSWANLGLCIAARVWRSWAIGCSRLPGDTVGVAIEVPHGPVVDTLVDRGFAVHAVNPKQLDRLRDRFSPAGAKDDRRA